MGAARLHYRSDNCAALKVVAASRLNDCLSLPGGGLRPRSLWLNDFLIYFVNLTKRNQC